MSPAKSRQKLGARDTGKKDKVVVEKVVEEELPPGWKVELKTRKGSNGKKRDWYYTDPVTGSIFRSLIDVQRYLKTGKVGRLAKKPKIAETDNKKVEGSESKEQLKVSTPMAETLGKSELPQRASKRLAGVAIDPPLPPPSPPEPKTRKTTRSSAIKIDTPPPPPPPPPPEPKTVKATRPAKTHVDPPPPPPSSPPVPKEEAQTRPPIVLAIRNEKHNKPETQKTTNADMAVTQKLVKKSNKGKAKSDDTPATLPPVNHHSIPPPEKQPANNPTQEPSSSISDFWTDPCIEFAVKTLTGGAIPFGELNSKADRSALEVPMEEMWTDPCIEFAVKTLTGAIPVSTSDMGMVFSRGNNNMQLDSVGHKSGNISFHQQVNGPRFFQ